MSAEVLDKLLPMTHFWIFAISVSGLIAFYQVVKKNNVISRLVFLVACSYFVLVYIELFQSGLLQLVASENGWPYLFNLFIASIFPATVYLLCPRR